jgi:glycosyltransferase involved in cell wall biosynthesis
VELDQFDTEYPRVLVVDAASFHRRSDLSIFKSNLFQGWPSDSLAQVIVGEDRPDFSVCQKYWRITRNDFVRRRSGRKVICDSLGEENHAGASRGQANRLRSQKLSDQVRAVLGYLPYALPIPISNDFQKWLIEFRPQVIFTIGNGIHVLSSVLRFSEYLKIPIVSYFTDDYIRWYYKRGPLDAFMRHRLVKAFRDCLQRSPVRLTISEAMSEEYTRRYGGEFYSCMDIVTLNDFLYKPYEIRQRQIKLLFTGVLEPDRWRSLKLLVDSLQVLREEGIDVSLDIYTFPGQIEKYGSLLHSPPISHVHGPVPFAEVPRLLSDADILVHVEAFGLKEDAMMALSLSTKIPQYLASGRAILGVGPSQVASMQYLKRSGAGIVVGQEDGPALKDAVRRLVCDVDMRVRLARKAREMAETNHDAIVGRNRFKRFMSKASQSHSFGIEAR